MDEIDRKIVELLRGNSRMAYTEMAKRLALSEGTVRKRVRELVQTGVIRRFTIETADENPEALVLVTTSPGIATSSVAEQILKVGGVRSIFEVAGQFDISAIVSGEDIACINQGIDRIRSIKGVRNTNTLFVLRKWR